MKIALTGGLATGKNETFLLLHDKLPAYKFVRYEDLLQSLFETPEFRARAKRAAGADSFEKLRPLLLQGGPVRCWFDDLADRWLDSQLDRVLAVNPRIVVELPRLLESARHLRRFDYIVSTVTGRLDQYDALSASTGLSGNEVAALVAPEYSPELRAVCCDFTIYPRSVEPGLPQQVDRLVADIRRVGLRKRAEGFFGSKHVWEELEPRLQRLDHRLHAMSVLGGLLELLTRHRNLTLNFRSIELALWFLFSGPATLNLTNAPAWAGQSAQDMWACLRRYCPELLDQGETVALAAQMLLSARLGQAAGVDTLLRPHWQRDIGLFLDLINAYFAQMSAEDLLTYASGVEQAMTRVMAPGESFCIEAFSRWYCLEGPFHRPEMADEYGERLLQLRNRVEETILSPDAWRQTLDQDTAMLSVVRS